jgi:zinc transporter ZupT
MKNTKKIIPILFLFMVLLPVFASAVTIMPNCGGHIVDSNGNVIGEQLPCGFNDLLKLVNNIINWIIWISIPVAAGVFAWAGIQYMMTGVSDKKSAAKAMLQKVFIGFVCILAAWLIVGTIIKALLKDPSIVPVDLGIEKSINFITNQYV